MNNPSQASFTQYPCSRCSLVAWTCRHSKCLWFRTNSKPSDTPLRLDHQELACPLRNMSLNKRASDMTTSGKSKARVAQSVTEHGLWVVCRPSDCYRQFSESEFVVYCPCMLQTESRICSYETQTQTYTKTQAVSMFWSFCSPLSSRFQHIDQKFHSNLKTTHTYAVASLYK